MARLRVDKNIYLDDVKNLYYVNLDFGKDENGKRIQKSKTFAKKSDAQKALTLHNANKINGTSIAPKETTLKDWLQYWMNDIIKITGAATTAYGYQMIIDNHIVPELGSTVLQKLTPSQIQSYYAKMSRDKSLSQKTIRKHHDLLNTALKLAEKQDKILKNPMNKVDAPKPEEHETQYYPPDQLYTLIELIKDDPIEIVVYLGAFLGMRRGEICGLRWVNVDMTNRVIHIKEVRTAAGSTIVEKDPKSKSSKRDLEFGDDIYDALTREQKRQEAAKAYLKTEYPDSGLVAVWNDGKPYRPNYLSEIFTRFIKSKGLPYITLHGLRHSFASAANAANVTLFDISKTLGHSNTSITARIYTHLVDTNSKQTMQKVADIIKKPTKKE